MRNFELALVYGGVFAVGWPAIFGVRPRRGIVALLLLTLFVVHWRVEGTRWQMIPIYGAALGMAIGDIVMVERDLDWTRRLARGVFGSAALGISLILPLALPVPKLPVPSGTLQIGTLTTEVVEADNPEVYGPSPGEPRRINVQVWYPAVETTGLEPAIWTEDWEVVTPALSKNLGFPGWFLSHTRYVKSHAYPGAPIAVGSYPIVIYSHGWTGFRTVAVNQIESLVSNGYIVIAADHTYGAIATVFADGEVAKLDPAALPDESDVGKEAHDDAGRQLIDVFARDIVAILDALDQGDSGPFAYVTPSADLTRVGVYGHSAGGGAAVEVCLQDERCDAVLGMDAWVEPFSKTTLALTPTRPAMFLRSDEWRGNQNDGLLSGIAGRNTDAVSYWVGIEGAGHNDFVVAPLFSPIAARLGLKGPIPAGRIIPIIDRYLVGFFDVALLGTGSASIDTPSFDEVSVEVIQPETPG